MVQIIDQKLLDSLAQEAASSPRLRKNLNLHSSYEEPCQRLVNALAVGTYIRPHRHLTPEKPESFIVLKGRMALLIFDDSGTVEKALVMCPGGETVGADIPPGVWHMVIALDEGAIFFETKPGPYVPLSDKDFAPWAPEEGDERANDYLAELTRMLGEGVGQ